MRGRLLAALCILFLGWAAADLAAAPSGKKKRSPAVKAKAGAKKSGAKKSASRKPSSSKSRSAAARRPAWRPGQRIPSPERYREIQQALASRGYLQSEPNGVWGESSIAALKKFQQDQNLEPTGRLTSLSLIALGLGPKRDAPPAAQP